MQEAQGTATPAVVTLTSPGGVICLLVLYESIGDGGGGVGGYLRQGRGVGGRLREERGIYVSLRLFGGF